MGGLEIRDLTVRYGDVAAVSGVSLRVAPGEILALLGPSGCGKSTLLQAVVGLLRPASGVVAWDGADVDGVPVHRRGFGLMFQDGQLFPQRSVADNIAYGLAGRRIDRVSGLEAADADGAVRRGSDGSASSPAGGRQSAGRRGRAGRRAARVQELLDLVGLDGYGPRPVSALSGGEAQRVALARALAPRPRLLLLDEPLSALDTALRRRLAREVRRILGAERMTAIFVTHDLAEAFAVADRLAVMADGRIEQVGAPEALWRRPATRRVAELMGCRWLCPPTALTALGVDLAGLTAAASLPTGVTASATDPAPTGVTASAADAATQVGGLVIGLRPGSLRLCVRALAEAPGPVRLTPDGPVADVAVPGVGAVAAGVDESRDASAGGVLVLDPARTALIG